MTERRKEKHKVTSDRPKEVEEQSFFRPQHPFENITKYLYELTTIDEGGQKRTLINKKILILKKV